jgi:hypothetical protein
MLNPSLLPHSVSHDTFSKLHDLIMGDPVFENRGPRPQAPVRYQLACYLIRFGNVQSVKTATALQLSEGSMYNHIRRVTRAFRNLRDLYIRWPGEEERKVLRREAQKHGFPGAVGATDGSYIPIIDRPRRNPMAFRCRKKFWAVSAIYLFVVLCAQFWFYYSGMFKLLSIGTAKSGHTTSGGLGAHLIEQFGATRIYGVIATNTWEIASIYSRIQVCIYPISL